MTSHSTIVGRLRHRVVIEHHYIKLTTSSYWQTKLNVFQSYIVDAFFGDLLSLRTYSLSSYVRTKWLQVKNSIFSFR